MNISPCTRVSTLIPCFNAGKWIAATLTSALHIDWPDHEIVVVDDGSTDESVDIVRSFSDPRIVHIQQPNKGASYARNRALQASTGDFIQYLDADDLIAPDKVRIQLQRLSRSPAGSIASGEWGRFINDPESARFAQSSLQEDLSGVEFVTRHCDTGDMMQPSAWLAPRQLLEAIGPWNESLTLNDDGEYFARAALAATTVVYCPGARCYYRSGLQQSLSRRSDRKSILSLYRSVELTIGHLLKREDSRNTRSAAANCWHRLAWEVYPELPREAKQALAHARALGGANRPMPMSGKVRLLSLCIGWKAAKRLHRVYLRFANRPGA